MGGLISRPKAPAVPAALYQPAAAPPPPPPPVQDGAEDADAQAEAARERQRAAGLLTRARGLDSTILTGLRGLDEPGQAALPRKQLLGE